jgi:uncharacterized protein (TIGR00156 family)
MKKILPVVLFASLLFALDVSANFTGPSVTGQASTVQQVMSARVGSYVTLTGNIVSHQREEYFTFQDDTGTLRVEIGNTVWRGRDIRPETRIKLFGEIDSGPAGRYLWVKSLDVVN